MPFILRRWIDEWLVRVVEECVASLVTAAADVAEDLHDDEDDVYEFYDDDDNLAVDGPAVKPKMMRCVCDVKYSLGPEDCVCMWGRDEEAETPSEEEFRASFAQGVKDIEDGKAVYLGEFRDGKTGAERWFERQMSDPGYRAAYEQAVEDLDRKDEGGSDGG